MKQQICILGSTGSIGTQALDVVRQHPDLYEVYALTAHHNIELLARQAREFRPAAVVIADETHREELALLLSDLPEIKVYAGQQGVAEIVESEPITTVLTAMVGFSGLVPTIHAIRAGKRIALANKETLVVAGQLICDLIEQHRVPVLPVDSEHSAIFQCLTGENPANVAKLLLTCSGGPFRNHTTAELARVTAADALRHPTWDMGAKITIDSATLMNKGFEVIEAKWLFGIAPQKIEVLVHPQSIVHSAVEFLDGSVKAQLGVPDMRLPIQYAFSYPEHLALQGERLNLFGQTLEFLAPDTERFPCLALAYAAIDRGGNMPCVLNAANEVVNLAFRQDACSFGDIPRIIEQTMQRVPFEAQPDLQTYLDTDREARRMAESLLPTG